MLELESCLRRKTEEVVAKVMDGEAIIINLATGVYYSLDDAGAAMWSLIEEGWRLRDIADAIAAQYDVPTEQAAGDVLDLASALLQEDIVEVAHADGSTAHTSAPHANPRLSYTAPALHAYRDMEDLLALDPPTPSLSDIPWKA